MERKIATTNLKKDWENTLTITQLILTTAGTNNTIITMTGIGGIIIPALSLILTLCIGAVQPDYNPVKQTISELVYYPQGWLQTTDFIALGAWLVLLAIRFNAEFARRITTRIAIMIIGFIGLDFFVIAAFPTAYMGAEKTLTGEIHEKAAQIICLLFPVLCCLIAREFKVRNYWKKLAVFTELTAVAGFILAVIGAVVMVNDAAGLGLIERLIMLNAIIWFVVVGIHLYRGEHRTNRRPLHGVAHGMVAVRQTTR